MGFFDKLASANPSPPAGASGAPGFFEKLASEQPITAQVEQTAAVPYTYKDQPAPGAPPAEIQGPEQPTDYTPGYQPGSFDLNFDIPKGMQNKNFGDFWNRGAKEAGAIVEGLPVIGNVIGRRVMDTITPRNLFNGKSDLYDAIRPSLFLDGRIDKGFPNPAQLLTGNKTLGTYPFIRVMGQGPNRPSDLPGAAQMIGEGVQAPVRNWIDPLAHGDLGRVMGNFTARPLGTAMDALSIADPALKLGGAMKGPIAAIGRTPVAQGIVDYAALQGYGRAAQGLGTHGAELLKGAAEKINAVPVVKHARNWATIRNIIRSADQAWQTEFAAMYKGVADAYNEIPERLSRPDAMNVLQKNTSNPALTKSKDLMDIVTMGDMDKVAQAQFGPAWDKIHAFMKASDQVNKKLADKLIEAGVVTQAEVDTATVADNLLADLRQADPTVRAEVLNTPEGQALVRDRVEYFKRSDVRPVYFSIVAKKQADSVRESGGLFGGISKQVQKAAAAVPGGGAERPAFLTPRELGIRNAAKHEMNPLNAAEVTIRRELSFLFAKDLLEKGLKGVPIQGGVKMVNLEKFATADFFDKLHKATGFSTQFAKDLKDIEVPSVMAQQLRAALDEPPTNLGYRLMEISNQVFKTATLGLAPSWAGLQAGQSLGVSGFSKFRGVGPRELAASIMAHLLPFDPRTKGILPGGIVSGMHGERDLNAILKLIAPVTDRVYGVATAVDDYTRIAHFVYDLMTAADSNPATRIPLSKALNIMSRFDQVEKAAKNPVYALHAVKEVNKWFGDYSHLAAMMWREPRLWFPFFLWWLHAGSLTKAAAVQTPIKNHALAAIAASAPTRFQQGVDELHKHQSMVPSYDETGNQSTGPNGGPEYFGGKGGIIPQLQVFELLEQGYQRLSGNTDKTDLAGLALVNPVATLAVMMLGKNPQNMMDWNNPSLAQGGGKQYRLDPSTGEQVAQGSIHPNVFHLIARAYDPRHEAMLRDTLAQRVNDKGQLESFKPSDFTSWDAMNPKRDQQDEPLKNYPTLERMFYSITGFKPTESMVDPDEAAWMEEKNQRRISRTVGKYQPNRQTTVPTWVGDLLGGKK